ncbi:MAG: KH domain-containing protein [Selenomonadales bacterium]|nr:KH domain-containing protein [Selenomonadales bacterium]MDD6218685.1 KH domain-containing protein [Selenomonadaceae bacterium]
MKEIVEIIAKALVDNPDQVVVEEKADNDVVTFELHVSADDMGKVIGKQGRIAKALRTVVKAAATRENKKVNVEII